jgi:Protein of unknown function (DUF1236)
MRSKLLIMSTAALLAGTLAAASQSIQPGGAAPEKGQQGLKSNEGTRDQATKGGQAQRSRDEDKLKDKTQGQAERDLDKSKGKTQGQAERDLDKAKGQTQGQAERDQDKLKGQTKGQAERDQDKAKGRTQGQAADQDKQKGQTQGQAQRGQDLKSETQGQAQGESDKQRPGQPQGQIQIQRDQDRVQQGQREGQRSGNSTISFTTEQRTKIRETVLKEKNAPRVSKVDFSLNVGTAVPRTVRVIEIPEVIVDIHPEWRGYRYFIVNEELVIVEPDTLKIVAIIDV